MKGVYTRSDSPYYWIRYYDKSEEDKNKKRKSYNTKIFITVADKRRNSKAKTKPPLQGTPELKRIVNSLRTGLAERNLQLNTGIKLKKDLKLSEGFAQFKISRMVPGSNNQLKQKTIQNYDLAVDHMIQACGDKLIYKYSSQVDYVALLNHFENLKVRGKKTKNKKGKEETQYRSLSINSRSIYTRALRSLWNYFVSQEYAAKNIIEATEPEDKDPNPIPLDDMYVIIQYLKADKQYPHHYWIIYFMLLTGCRPSSAIVQLKEDIDFRKKQIIIRNIKTGRRKKKEYYRFPLYSELMSLLKEMNVNEGETGRLFNMYSVVPENYTWPLTFWKRGIRFLKMAKKISKEYTLKQIRPTLASFLINTQRMDIYSVQKLLDHTDIKVTDKHYVDFKLKSVREDLDDITSESFLD